MIVVCLAFAGCNSTRARPHLAPTQARLGQPLPTQSNCLLGSPTPGATPPSAGDRGEIQVVDLPAALGRAGVANPTIALAEEAVRSSLAERTLARSLLFPNLDAGANYRLHHGQLQGSRRALDE